MSTISDYAYINARVSVLATHLLSDERLTDILNQPIGQQHIGIPALDELLNDKHFNSNHMEQAWLMDLLGDFKILVRPLAGKAKELLTYWFRKYEMTNLKTIVRGKMAGLDANAIAEQLIEVGPIATLPVEELLRTEDISELLRRLDNSPYGNIARHARRVFELNHQLYSLDAAIDRNYLLELDKRVRALDVIQRKYLLPLIGISMDRFNLLWLLRYRFAYHLSPAETYYLLLPTSYQLNPTNLFALVELNTLQEVLTHLPSTLQHLLTDVDCISTVENRINAEIRRIAEHTLQWHSFSLAKVIAYMTLRELEMHRVLAIIKGKKLGLKMTHIQTAAELL
jgi:V/A-type H+-transporting ATPase subunit C